MKTSVKNLDRVSIFISGNSQAIRLPKKYRLTGQTALIERKGKSLVITPEDDVWRRLERGVAGLSAHGGMLTRQQPKIADKRGKAFP
jgi:antitoxin VapB